MLSLLHILCSPACRCSRRRLTLARKSHKLYHLDGFNGPRILGDEEKRVIKLDPITNYTFLFVLKSKFITTNKFSLSWLIRVVKRDSLRMMSEGKPPLFDPGVCFPRLGRWKTDSSRLAGDELDIAGDESETEMAFNWQIGFCKK